MWLVPAQIIVVVCFFTVLVSFLFSINLLNTSWYQQLLNQKLISKVMIILSINMILGLLTPFVINYRSKQVNFIGWKAFIAKLLFAIFTVFVAWLFYD